MGVVTAKQIPATAANARILNPFIHLSSIVRLSSIVATVVYLPHAFTITTQISLDLSHTYREDQP